MKWNIRMCSTGRPVAAPWQRRHSHYTWRERTRGKAEDAHVLERVARWRTVAIHEHGGHGALAPANAGNVEVLHFCQVYAAQHNSVVPATPDGEGCDAHSWHSAAAEVVLAVGHLADLGRTVNEQCRALGVLLAHVTEQREACR